MGETMLGYVEQTPEGLRRLLETRKACFAAFEKATGDCPVEGVTLLGSGSSYHAALIARPFVERVMGVPTDAFTPTAYGDCPSVGGKNRLLVFLSQSGMSTNTIRAARHCALPKNRILCVTEKADSPIGQSCGFTLSLPWTQTEDIGPKTKGVTCTAAQVMLFFLEMARARGKTSQAACDQYTMAFERLHDGYAETLARCQAWYEENRVEMGACGFFAILSGARLMGTALEGALKLMETIYRSVCAYDFEEYLHGPCCALDEKTGIIVLEDGIEDGRARRFAQFAARNGAHVFFVGDTRHTSERRTLSLAGTGDTLVDALAYLVPFQVLSARLSEFLGIDAGQSRFPDFHVLMRTKVCHDA